MTVFNPRTRESEARRLESEGFQFITTTSGEGLVSVLAGILNENPGFKELRFIHSREIDDGGFAVVGPYVLGVTTADLRRNRYHVYGKLEGHPEDGAFYAVTHRRIKSITLTHEERSE